MDKIAINSFSLEEKTMGFLKSLLDELSARQKEVIVSAGMRPQLEALEIPDDRYPTYDGPAGLKGAEIVLSIGGDGTLLDTITYVRDAGIPVLGINTGTLGFLSTTPIDQYADALDRIESGDYSVESRSLLTLQTSADLFAPINFALNDFTIVKRDTSSMIVVNTYVDGKFLNSYWADGLIVSTPTGSTGYSLSVGGPIVSPDTDNFILSPISPHNLNSRPLVVSDKSEIRFRIGGRTKTCLVSLDSRSFVTSLDTDITVKKCDFDIKLLSFSQNIFYDALKSKLNWGLDIRNY